MIRRVAFAAALLLAAVAASAQDPLIDYTPVSCMRAGQMPVLQLAAGRNGELRAFFRKVNTTDWCSVLGDNLGKVSRIVLPKFDSGDEIEYFIVLLDGKKVVAKSPRIYRARVTDGCEVPMARHMVMMIMDCGQNGPGSVPSSLAAGYAMKDTITNLPTPGSPDRP